MSVQQQASGDTLSQCTTCGKSATNKCARCHSITYCGVECQKEDWYSHKHLCKSWPEFGEHPGTGKRRVIVLPVDRSRAHFAWMETTPEPVTWRDGYDGGLNELYGVPEYDKVPYQELSSYEGILNPSGSIRAYPIVLGKLGGGEHLDHSLHVLHLDDFMLRGYARNENKCLGYHSKGRSQSKFGGPLALIAMSKVAEPSIIQDIAMTDFKLALDGLIKLDENEQALQAAADARHPQPKLSSEQIAFLRAMTISADEDEVLAEGKRRRQAAEQGEH